MPRRLPTTCAKLTAEKWAQLRREAEAAEESRVSGEVLAAEGTDVGYGILREGSDIVEMTGSEYLRQMHESNRAQSDAMAEEWNQQAEAELARMRAEDEATRVRAEERARVTAEHRLAEEQLKAEVTDCILVGQMKNMVGFVEKQKQAEEAFRAGCIYVPESSGSGSFYTDSGEQGSSPDPPPAAAQGGSGSGDGAAMVILLSDDE